ncbi:MAG: SH3 domain-containing protein [Rhizobiaceae bacterium]
MRTARVGRRNPQRTAAIIAACTVGVVGVAFGGLLVSAHSDQAGEPTIQTVKVRTVKVAVSDATVAPAPDTQHTPAAATEPAVAGDAKTARPALADAAMRSTADAAVEDALVTDDPRWARTETGATLQFDGGSDAGSALAALAPSVPTGNRAAAALAREEGKDEVQTAAIEPDEAKPAKKATAAAVSGDAPTRMAIVSADVRLRAGRNASSAIVGVVPRGTEIGVVSCDGWCEVVYAGKRGFVYNKFIGGGKITQAAPQKPQNDGELRLFGGSSAKLRPDPQQAMPKGR